VRRIIPHISRSEIQKLWERNCDAFIWKEAELQGKRKRNTRDFVFFSKISSDQYGILLVKFPKELFHWIYRLQEAPEFQERVNKTYTWDTDKITKFHQLDQQIMRAVEFWVCTTMERYIVEFVAENHKYFSRAE
jgi:hypothetical protein